MGVADGPIALRRREEAESYYTSKRGRNIGNKVFRVRLGKQGMHLARRVFETRRWDMEHKQVQIEWDTNLQLEWVNGRQIKRVVNEEGKGKRDHQTVAEARLAAIKRLKEEHETSERNLK